MAVATPATGPVVSDRVEREEVRLHPPWKEPQGGRKAMATESPAEPAPVPIWRDALAGGLTVSGLVTAASVSPWLGAGLLAGGLLAGAPRLKQVEAGLDRVGHGLIDFISQSIEGWSEAYRQKPAEGPERQEYFLKKFLKEAERSHGKGDIYTLGQRLRLADFYRESYRAMDVAEHLDQAVKTVEAEIRLRGGSQELDRLVPACASGYPDVASVFERAGEFFLLYAQPEKAVGLLRRAVELAPPGERRVSLQERLAAEVGDPEAASLRREAFSSRLERALPTDESLADPARALARSLERSGQEAGGWYALSLFLDCGRKPDSDLLRGGYLKQLAGLYGAVGESKVAASLHEEAQICQLEASARGALAGPALRRDLERLVEIYERRGEESALVRTRHRLQAVRDRCEARQTSR